MVCNGTGELRESDRLRFSLRYTKPPPEGDHPSYPKDLNTLAVLHPDNRLYISKSVRKGHLCYFKTMVDFFKS